MVLLAKLLAVGPLNKPLSDGQELLLIFEGGLAGLPGQRDRVDICQAVRSCKIGTNGLILKGHRDRYRDIGCHLLQNMHLWLNAAWKKRVESDSAQ